MQYTIRTHKSFFRWRKRICCLKDRVKEMHGFLEFNRVFELIYRCIWWPIFTPSKEVKVKLEVRSECIFAMIIHYISSFVKLNPSRQCKQDQNIFVCFSGMCHYDFLSLWTHTKVYKSILNTAEYILSTMNVYIYFEVIK